MKKIFLSIMLVGALLVSGTVYAQNQVEGTTGASVQKENTQNGKDKKKASKAKKDGKKSDQKSVTKSNRPKYNPFDGIQLTDDQQKRLQVLRQGLGPVELTPEQKAKIKENSQLTPEQKQQLKKERNDKKMEAKKNYLNGVKEILTPDQYVVFLENVYLYSPQNQGSNQQVRQKKAVKSDKKNKKSARKSKQTKTNNQ